MVAVWVITRSQFISHTAVIWNLPSIPTASLSPGFLAPFRVQHPRRFSKCSISDYKEFLLKGGGSCLFNRPTKVRLQYHATCSCASQLPWIRLHTSLASNPPPPFFLRQLFEPTECGNGFVEVGEECDCGARAVSLRRGLFVVGGLLFAGRAQAPLPVCLQECYKECCKKCSLANGAHCSDGPCCNTTCLVPACFCLLLPHTRKKSLISRS